MLCELRQRLLALGYEFEMVDENETPDVEETPGENETPDVEESGILSEPEIPDETETPEEVETPSETETPEETGKCCGCEKCNKDEALTESEKAALRLALRRALVFVRQFCNRLEKTDEWPRALREAALDLAAAYFLQAKMALRPDSLAVLPTLTSLRMGNASWGFGGGTQKSGTDALTRMDALASSLLRDAKAALCAWRSL